MSDDDEEDGRWLQMPHQRQDSDPIISLDENLRDLVRQDHEPVGTGLTVTSSQYMGSETLYEAVRTHQSFISELHAHPNYEIWLETDASSLIPSLAIPQVPVPNSELAGGFPVQENSPKGSPDVKYEEFVPNSNLDERRRVFRSRTYQSSDIDISTTQGRLASFYVHNWGVSFMSRRQLAEAGFMYYGHEDEVVCIGCNRSLMGWEDGDDPLTEHRRHFGYDCFSREQLFNPYHAE